MKAPVQAPLAPAAGPSVRLQGVGLQLGATRILQGIDWQVQPGQVHALVGPNGCGKSSLIKTVLGLMPHEGSVTLHWPGAAPGVLAYVPQAIECDRTLPMTVQDFMACMLQTRPLYWGIRRSVRERIAAALAQVGMAHKAGRRMGDLSGGERQRVLLAQSLAPPAQLVLLDEPMAALDQAGIAVFESLLAAWRQARATVLWVEHDLGAVRRLADHVTALRQGRLLWSRPPAALHDAEVVLQLFARRGPAGAGADADTGTETAASANNPTRAPAEELAA
ncbi:metal ABC transporter ATP-binding protein [Vandammella animalimorsus]|uniref:Metal ABC transporter ATP-binding protein n=2 Tax=Vandammella animalimorsus TaxID=2029117 RepID=A0A3M6R589_9BURK|nr:metal ABC transporter ATP-binding protein [Vandammella animalimorsus]